MILIIGGADGSAPSNPHGGSRSGVDRLSPFLFEDVGSTLKGGAKVSNDTLSTKCSGFALRSLLSIWRARSEYGFPDRGARGLVIICTGVSRAPDFLVYKWSDLLDERPSNTWVGPGFALAKYRADERAAAQAVAAAVVCRPR
jgi:hypothetical protein